MYLYLIKPVKNDSSKGCALPCESSGDDISKQDIIVAIIMKTEFSARYFPGHILQEICELKGHENTNGRLTFVQNQTHRHSDR